MRLIQITVNVPDDFDTDDLWEIEQAAQEYVNDQYPGEITVSCNDCGTDHEPGNHDFCEECSMYHPCDYICDEGKIA